MVQQDVAWEDIFPAVFLLASLVLQLVLLVTGELRKCISTVKLFAWLAYVGADNLANFLLGFLSRMKLQSGLFGLWSALLIYHLGGPDNFTAYERADSELWLRHLLYLGLQVLTAAYVIAVNTRGFLLIPTLLVFVVGVLRYWERNQALKKSSRQGINKAMAPVYLYMKTQGFPDNGCCPDKYLEYVVAGTKDWYEALKAGQAPETKDFVTTADIYNVVTTKMKLSQSDCVRACQLSVALASSFAYLRRVISLTRREQESSRSNMRMLWLLKKERIEKHDWLAYIRIEQDFLYDWLYAKPPYPNTYMSRLFLRVLSSIALFGALAMVFVRADENMWGSSIYKGLNKDATYVVLAAGFFVESAYLLRLLVSKWAVVAMLVAVVRTQQARLGSLGKLRASFVLLMCRLSLSSIGFFERKFSNTKRTYLPRSSWLVRHFPRCHWLMDKLSISEPGWDQMIRAVSPNESEFQAQLQGIQAQENPAIDILLTIIMHLTDYNLWSNHLSGGERTEPFHMHLDIFVDYYNSNWEDVLLMWWIGTLKVLILEGQPDICLPAIEIEIVSSQATTLPALVTNEIVSSRDSKVTQATQTSEDINGTHVQDIEIEEAKVKISSNGSLSKEESTSKDKKTLGKNLRQTDSQMSDNIADFGALRNRALWLMAYVGRLLTVCPELLPTHLEHTKRLVADELRIAHQQIRNPTRWVTDTRRRVESLEIPALEVGEHRSVENINSCISRMKQEGFVDRDIPDHIDKSSSELAVLLVQHMSMEDRWTLIEGSASHFIACLANANKNAEHCAKLTQGGELQTTLWILFSHLGGGTA